jgi:hypothetical protein
MNFYRCPEGIAVWFNNALLFVASEEHVNQWLKEGGFNCTWRGLK